MPEIKPLYSKEEFARRGGSIYEKNIRPTVESQNEGKFVLIDIESGDYEMDADEMDASHRLLVRRPNAQVWMVRVGRSSARNFGGRGCSPS